MSSQQVCESGSAEGRVTEADAIRTVYERDTMKRLSRLTGAPIDTCRHWLYRHFNPAQRREVARALLSEMDRQDVGRDAVRRRLAEWAAEE